MLLRNLPPPPLRLSAPRMPKPCCYGQIAGGWTLNFLIVTFLVLSLFCWNLERMFASTWSNLSRVSNAPKNALSINDEATNREKRDVANLCGSASKYSNLQLRSLGVGSGANRLARLLTVVCVPHSEYRDQYSWSLSRPHSRGKRFCFLFRSKEFLNLSSCVGPSSFSTHTLMRLGSRSIL